ncbi:MAG: prepilin-type N-terminal cleavage/methylation domain-containing protein [Phycisphaerales bacterium]|nr:prepilin-type N-terminal cleavage/methylation domain-containing protein [Phycisphaerales bacterium]
MTRHGLTLLEVLIALALGLVLMGSVTTFAWSQLSSRDQVLEAANSRRSLTLAIDRLEQDLISVVAGTSDGQPGVAGDATSVTLFARGVSPSWTDDPTTMIGDLHRLVLSFDTGSGQLEMNRSPWIGGEADRPSVLPGMFQDLRFRYFDGDQWQDQWDSLARGRLPVAVEIAAWYGRPEVEEEEDGFESRFDRPAEMDDLAGELDPVERVPDRRRVILVPDASAEESSGPGEAMP